MYKVKLFTIPSNYLFGSFDLVVRQNMLLRTSRKDESFFSYNIFIIVLWKKDKLMIMYFAFSVFYLV